MIKNDNTIWLRDLGWHSGEEIVVLYRKYTIRELYEIGSFVKRFVKRVVDLNQELVALDADMHYELSPVWQMINIGNEVKRALKFSSDRNKRNMFLDTKNYK